MSRFLKAEEMYSYEEKIMSDYHVPVMVLMESAARAVVKQMGKNIEKTDPILILAGSGNNGGDGIAVGRILHNKGHKVNIHVSKLFEECGAQNQQQRLNAKSYGCPLKISFQEII